jgi:hypothetical protein
MARSKHQPKRTTAPRNTTATKSKKPTATKLKVKSPSKPRKHHDKPEDSTISIFTDAGARRMFMTNMMDYTTVYFKDKTKQRQSVFSVKKKALRKVCLDVEQLMVAAVEDATRQTKLADSDRVQIPFDRLELAMLAVFKTQMPGAVQIYEQLKEDALCDGSFPVTAGPKPKRSDDPLTEKQARKYKTQENKYEEQLESWTNGNERITAALSHLSIVSNMAIDLTSVKTQIQIDSLSRSIAARETKQKKEKAREAHKEKEQEQEQEAEATTDE